MNELNLLFRLDIARWLPIERCARQACRRSKQRHAPDRIEGSPLEAGCDFLAGDRWKRERQEVIVGHGERGWREVANVIGVGNHFLFLFNALSYGRQPQIHPLMNKRG